MRLAMFVWLGACAAPSLPEVEGEPDHSTPLEDDTSAPADDTGSPTDDTAGDTSGDSGIDTGSVDPDAAWDTFRARRDEILGALSVPIQACVAATDTDDPIFDGCLDWHSAVHGHWALYTLSRLLDDVSLAETADQSFTPEAVEAELQRIEASVPGEIPYGYAWFLALAGERRLRDDGLDPLALIVADALWLHLDGLSDVRLRAGVLADDYQNLSWAAINLWEWAEITGDESRADDVAQFVRDVILPLDAQCPLDAELADADNFFPACLLRAQAILTVLTPEEGATWLASNLPATYPLTPVTDITQAHEAGLNFSRCWGLWSVFVATGDTHWRDLFREHFEWQYSHPEYWAEDYASYSHWVPQFGVYALAEVEE